MINLILAGAYLATCLLAFPIEQAIGMGAIFVLALAGVQYFVGANSIVNSFRWFLEYRANGAMVIACTVILFIIGSQNNRDAWLETILNSTLFFFWYWVFSAWGTSGKSKQ